MVSSDIEDIISKANFDNVSHPISGDCASVAAGIKQVFGGKFVCIYHSQNNRIGELPTHVVVEIDGQLYDGVGTHTKETLFEFYIVANSSKTVQDEVEPHFVYEQPPDYMIDETVVEDVVSMLRSNTNNQ